MKNCIVLYCFIVAITSVIVFIRLEDENDDKSTVKSFTAGALWPIFFCFVFADGIVEWTKHWRGVK